MAHGYLSMFRLEVWQFLVEPLPTPAYELFNNISYIL